MKSENFEVILYNYWFSEDKLTIQQNEWDARRLEIDIDKLDELMNLLYQFKLNYIQR